MSLESAGMKRLLIASVAGNLFLVGIGVGVGVMSLRMASQRPAPRADLYVASRALPPADKEAMRQAMRAHAKEAMPEMQAARAARREASNLIAATTYDGAAISAALAKARQYDMNVRAKIDAGFVSYVGGLDQQRRALLVQAMANDDHRGGARQPRRPRR